MRPPRMVGVVERRLLVNYRTDPEITAGLVPPPLRPQLADLDEASAFFRRGGVGYSARNDEHRLDGLELRTTAWRVEPVEVLSASSTLFDDTALFPAGSAILDCALLMRDVPVTWVPLPPMTTLAGTRV
jgi:hypothetical protein